MSSRTRWEVLLVGESADLAARPFEAEWARVSVAEASSQDGSADLVIVLDPELDPREAGEARRMGWHPAAGGPEAVSRPWPVADDLFELPPSPRDDACLLLAPEGSDPSRTVERLTQRGLLVEVSGRATRDLLVHARIVACLGRNLPPETFAVLAAGRLLVAPAAERMFGLQPGIDHLAFSDEDELIATVDALATYPEAWAPVQAFARQTAEPHRAPRAIGRVVRRILARP
jgi:hypothetical protein